ncbi:zinc finger FYVE domain-containing protein 16 [Pogoniulus pusillus]|uniref:zinc finger FYVE domain-containing protein 16 n=1 Tax=Pogoniulus pusillus TaxID=488313 RepID=UPI0030B9798A
MDSYFKAAVCALDTLLDEFEQSTTDEYDCYRTPQNSYDSKHHSLSSVLDCLQCVYPTPKRQEDANSCTSSEEICLSSHTGTSEALPSYSQQNEKGVAGPDLLSTVDSGSLNEIQASNLGRCSVPVCDLVNDTGNLIHSAAAREDAQKLQPDDFQYREGLIGTSCIPVHTCVSSTGCSSVSSTEQSDGDSMLQDLGHLKPETNDLASKLNSYTTTDISGPCDDQHRAELVKCSGEFDQCERTADVNTPCDAVTSQNLDVYSPKDEKACKELPCEPQDENECSTVSKEMHGRNAVEKVDSKNKNNIESMPSDLTKRLQLHESHTVLPGNSVLLGYSCQTEAKVELEKKITEGNVESVDSKELHSSEILNTVSSSVKDVQASLSCLPLPASLCGSLIATEEKVNLLPQKEMSEVLSNILTVHTGKSSTDLSSGESCENTNFHEEEVYAAEVDGSEVEKSKDGEKYDTEDVIDDSDSQQIKAFVSGFLECEAEPYGVDIASDGYGIMSDLIVENVIKSDTLITDAELDAFLYGSGLQPSVLKSSDNDSLSVEVDVDEGYLANVNNLDITEVTEEHMQEKLDKITNINSNLQVSLSANELHSASEETVSHIQDMTESGSEALVCNVHGEGARPTQLLGLSQGAVGQRQLDSADVLETKKQEAGSLTPEAPLSDTNINIVGKNSDPVCSREINSQAGGNQTLKNAASPKIPATLSWKQPFWVPDSEAPNCMNCQVKFTFTKRRHHCRACGKVFCGACCKRKCKLQYMEKEARVCTGCYDYIKAQAFGKVSSTDPDLSSTTSCEPSADSPAGEVQTSGTSATPSSPMLVLGQPNIKELSPREERRVDFVNPLACDEIEDARRLSPIAQGLSPNAVKPEADDASTNVNSEPVEEVNLVTRMAELHSSFSSHDARQAIAGRAEVAHRFTLDTVETEECSAAKAVSTSLNSVPQAAGVTFPSPSRYRQLCGVENCVSRAVSLFPDGDQLPPLLLAVSEKEKGPLVEQQPSHQQVICLLAEGNPYPVTFILNANLLVNVKLMTYCSKKCWYFSTTGLHGLGQAEIIILLQHLPEEEIFPAEMLKLFIDIYKDAENGKLIKNMGYITFTGKFLGTEDLGGFLFVSPTYQKLDDQILPDKPYLCGILIHKVEIPSVKAFPSRLMSSLGAESGEYPMPLLSVRGRKPIFTEIGCRILQILTDFKNDGYTVDIIHSLFIHLENDRCCIKIPLRRYNEVMKVIDSSDEYVIIIGTNPSNEADSFLVCVQDEDGLYQSKTVSVTGCPRRVTSASFVVFKEATAAKYAVIEDGIIVHVTTETLQNLCKALRSKKDYKIICPKMDTGEVEKCVDICWVEDEDQTIKGILSPVDGLPMEGTLSEKMFHKRNFEGTGKALNCTKVYYFVNNYELTNPVLPVFADEVASGTIAALCPHIRSLKNSGMNKIGVRVSVATDTVEYTAGSEYCLLPQNYLNELDSTLVPVIHSRMLHPGSLPLKLELLFFIVEHLH